MVIGERISTALFVWNKQSHIFMSEISMIGADRVLGPLYNDACDQGFQLVSHKTGSVVHMVLSQIKREPEGDTMVWVFKPTPESVRTVPMSAGVEVHILND